MAEAKDNPSQNLLDRFSSQRLGPLAPARADERHKPVEMEQGESRDVGRRPEDVVPFKEPQPSAPAGEDDDDRGKLLQTRYKVRTGVGEGNEVIQEELTLEEIAKRGLMEKIVSTANQLPNVSRKYQELLEQVAKESKAPATAKPAEAPAKPVAPTQEQIYTAFLPMLKATVEAGHIEPDFAEAYPQMATGLMYYRWMLEDGLQRLGHVIEWIKAEAEKRERDATIGLLNSAIDQVAALSDGEKGDPFYAGLKEKEIRDAFVNWLFKEVDPKVGSINAVSMGRYWVTLNAKDLLKFTKDAAAKVVETPAAPARRRAAGDGSGSRPGKPESPAAPSLLDRMTASRLGEEI